MPRRGLNTAKKSDKLRICDLTSNVLINVRPSALAHATASVPHWFRPRQEPCVLAFFQRLKGLRPDDHAEVILPLLSVIQPNKKLRA